MTSKYSSLLMTSALVLTMTACSTPAVEEPSAQEPAAVELVEEAPVEEAPVEAVVEEVAYDMAAAPAAIIADADIYYQLQTKFTEPDNKCLEGQGGAAPESGAVLDGAGFMNDCQKVTGQFWKFVPESDGYYRMQNQIGEANDLCAEGNRLADESELGGGFVMMACDDVSGQLWKLVDAGEGYYRFTTQFRESENKCLESQKGEGDVLEGSVFQDDCQDVTGQYWRLVPQETDAAAVEDAGDEASDEAAVEEGAAFACYWQNDASNAWVAMDDYTTEEECVAQDSCYGGGGLSMGGCYKWTNEVPQK